MTKTPDDSKHAHMAKRVGQGLTQKQAADEFGTSRSSIQRKVAKHKAKQEPNALRDGYTEVK